jgi:hypothetical protein
MNMRTRLTWPKAWHHKIYIKSTIKTQNGYVAHMIESRTTFQSENIKVKQDWWTQAQIERLYHKIEACPDLDTLICLRKFEVINETTEA